VSEVVNKTVGVGSCYPHPDNYNQHSYEQIVALQESLRVFSQVRSIVVQDDGQGGYLITAGEGIWTAAAGEGIWTAAKREGLETLRADVIPTDWPSERVKAYLAADNELARLGDPDLSQLAALVEDVGSVDETLARLAAGTEERLAELVNIDFTVPNPSPQQEPQLTADHFIEIYCARLDLEAFRPTLTEWSGLESVTINIS
jgi:hypothetical protein